MQNITAQLAQEIGVGAAQVAAAVALLDAGATVPFIARYRKEATGGLDDIQLREIDSRLTYLREMQDRLQAIVASIQAQGKMTPALLAALQAATTKQALEDLYLPFRQKRRTKGQIAREAGLEALADLLWADPTLDPQAQAQCFVKPEKNEAGDDFTTLAAVLDGVRDILSERWAEDATVVQTLREWLWAQGLFQSRLREGQDADGAEAARFRDYFAYDEPIARVPSHRAMAVFRGRALNVLDARLAAPEPEVTPALPRLAIQLSKKQRRWCRRQRRGSRCAWVGSIGAGLPTICCASVWPGPGASSSACPLNAICWGGCASRPSRSRSRCLRPICASCCWPRRPAPAW